MFDIGWTEILIVMGIALVVVGPKELPKIVRTIGKRLGEITDKVARERGVLVTGNRRSTGARMSDPRALTRLKQRSAFQSTTLLRSTVQ